MEALNLPLREIEERYTLSEISLMAWRSQEQGHQMRQRMKPATANSPTREAVSSDTNDARMQELELLCKDIPEADFMDEDGRFTTKKLPGHIAVKFMALQGFTGFGSG